MVDCPGFPSQRDTAQSTLPVVWCNSAFIREHNLPFPLNGSVRPHVTFRAANSVRRGTITVQSVFGSSLNVRRRIRAARSGQNYRALGTPGLDFAIIAGKVSADEGDSPSNLHGVRFITQGLAQNTTNRPRREITHLSKWNAQSMDHLP